MGCFPDTKLQGFISHSVARSFASSFGLGEKCVSHFLLRILGNIAKLHHV